MEKPAIVWFRRDLRIADNPALNAAVESGSPTICIYIREEEAAGMRPLGGAARWWLHGSLETLNRNLIEHGADLVILTGDATEILASLCVSLQPSAVFWNRRYDAAGIAVDTAAKTMLGDRGVRCESFNGSLLFEPWEVKSGAGGPMRVFYTPFWKAARAKRDPAPPTAAPREIRSAKWTKIHGLEPVSLKVLDLTPSKPDWAAGFKNRWTPGENGARERLADFLDEDLDGYSEHRDRPDRPGTSRLSPHLAFGDISPRQIWSAAYHHALARGGRSASDLDKFQSELGWREFSYHLLFHYPDLATRNFEPRFNSFPWRDDGKALAAWREGQTGYPIVDAGMRQLWTIGWMHNRVRMIVASFLIKHLLIDWREGERWFWDTLVDADPANNPASWQWVAGTGADAAPYFRIFNPILQGEKFDPEGAYVREWVPELKRLPNDVIHRPWGASEEALQKVGVKLGENYPRPIVDHAAARQRALAALKSIRGAD